MEPLKEVGVRRSAHAQAQTQAQAQAATESDRVAVEAPVALVFNGISHAVMMATPADLEAFALGFALTEGLLERRDECFGIDILEGQRGCEVQIEIAAAAEMRLKERRRNLAGRTGCGLCGIDSLQALDLTPTPLSSPLQIEAAAIARAFEQLPHLQVMNKASGAHHAAGWASPDGELIQVMEDVGRHNALDKLLGSRVLARESLSEGFVIMSSRASSELVLKCARLKVPLLATISAPTSMAIEIAANTGMALYGWCRGERSVRYA
ncbi:formate dehydrogenase accessory sulfurtransferase FdhD [Burkholderiaceae bacterium UC74_6]